MMQLPEQQALMEQMFKGGKMIYEMSLVGNRIYMGTEGELAETSTTPPIEINANTRLAGSMNVISMMKMGGRVGRFRCWCGFLDTGCDRHSNLV